MLQGRKSLAARLAGALTTNGLDMQASASSSGQAVSDLVGLRVATKGHDALPGGDGEGPRVQGEVMLDQVNGHLMVDGLIRAGERAQDVVLADDADQAARIAGPTSPGPSVHGSPPGADFRPWRAEADRPSMIV